MGVRNVPRAGCNRSAPHNRKRPRPHKPRANVQDAAVAAAAVAIEEKKPLRIRHRRRHSSNNNRVRRASRVRPARRAPRRKVQHLAPRATARKSADVSAVEGAVAAVAHRRAVRLRLDLYVCSAMTLAASSNAGRLSRRWRAVHSAKPSQRMQ